MVRRILWRLRNFRSGYYELINRAKVEAEMWECLAGKRDMPNENKLREWVIRLGVPEEFRK